MTRFSFSHCPTCGRLNIHGAQCVCTPPAANPPIDCDCTGGNQQTIGPRCRKRIKNVWADALNQSHAIAQHIRANQETDV